MHSPTSEQDEKASLKDDLKEASVASNVLQPNLQLDTGEEYYRFRRKWWQLW